MEPVLCELRPQLKVIREQLAALSLQKSLPRMGRKIENIEKENSSIESTESVSKEDSYCGKAGKSVYPVLVGEVTHLYKTSKLSLRKSKPFQRITTLDLHGCSMDKALEMLHKGLHEWVEEAMKGEHPFVIPVNIICGGGNQILSEVVAQFIRDNPQVANRPRGAV
jgi:DNA-nicking Smr family endonuclease